MKVSRQPLFPCASLLVLACQLHAAELPEQWKNIQTLQLTRAGLIKISVPLETLSAARPGLEDLRLYDSAGKEIPFLVEQSAPAPAMVRPPKHFSASVSGDTTIATLETGFTEPISSVTLETPAPSFLKAVRIEGSQNGRNWDVIVQGQPIFRQQNGASQLDISLPPARWAFFVSLLTTAARRPFRSPARCCARKPEHPRPKNRSASPSLSVRRSREPHGWRYGLTARTASSPA